jgi:hypothetical protein
MIIILEASLKKQIRDANKNITWEILIILVYQAVVRHFIYDSNEPLPQNSCLKPYYLGI